jgi:hypothetical protein
MAVAEYVVIMENTDVAAIQPKLTWNGALANCEISEPGSGKPVKTSVSVRVQAESAAEAITGAKQCFPGFVNGTIYGILKSSLTTG